MRLTHWTSALLPASTDRAPATRCLFNRASISRRGFKLDFDYRYVSALPGQLVPSYTTEDARIG